MAGLATSVRYVLDRGVEQVRAHERALTQRLLDGLLAIPGVRVIGTLDASRQTATVSFTIDGRPVSDVALALDEQFGVMCRPGLHCAPVAHRTLGTLPEGPYGSRRACLPLTRKLTRHSRRRPFSPRTIA